MNKTIRNIFLASLISAAVVTSAALATPAAAQTVDQLQAQIQELLAKVAALQEQLRVALANQTGQNVSSGIAQGDLPRVCRLLPARTLAQGIRGDEVASIQEFLQSEGFLSAQATGYFGPATQSALAHWQVAQGFDGVGILGPLSRERIRHWCQNYERFTASPTRGNAPLTVTFSTWLSGFRPQSISYTIDFGDGTSERALDCNAPADACISPGQNTHTYQNNGAYTATLNKITDPCGGNPACMAPIQSEVVAKVQIHVGQIACTKEYVPVCGSKPIVCITTPCNPIQQTYGNRCMMDADGATYLYDGVCRDTTPGNRPPSISSFSGPTTLSVSETGTWTIQASDPESGPLTYSILWGDESTFATGAVSAPAREFVQTTTFTHSYARAGTYTVFVTVRDNAGHEARASATVRIGGGPVACTLEYNPVCGRPPGCMNTCPPGMYCTMMCRLYDPVTYGNRCQLNAAGAEYLYDGACRAQ